MLSLKVVMTRFFSPKIFHQILLRPIVVCLLVSLFSIKLEPQFEAQNPISMAVSSMHSAFQESPKSKARTPF